MIFRQLFDRESCTYTYLIAGGAGGEAVLVDPVLEQLDAYTRLIAELDLSLVFAIDTHVHADHITALGKLRERSSCVTIMGEQSGAACVSRTVSDGEVIAVGDVELRAIYTPGHTDDSYCFTVADKVLTGDTLLIRGTGRTDFQNGDPREQYESIFGRLLVLPEDTEVWPAHDYKGWTSSTIGEERRHNPRLQVSSADEYAEIMNNLNLANPTMMDVAVAANRNCGIV